MMLRPLGIMAGRRGDHVAALRLLAEAVSVGATLDDRSCALAAVAFAAIEAVEIGQPELRHALLALLTKTLEAGRASRHGHSGFEEAIERCRATPRSASAFRRGLGRGPRHDPRGRLRVRRRAGRPIGPADKLARCHEPVEASGRASAAGAHAASPLTPREAEVARLLARGLSNKQIAAELVISERTVHAHVYRILGKLGLSSRAQVAAWAVANRLGD